LPVLVEPVLLVFTPSFILPELSTEIITFGATNADLDVGSGGSCTSSSAHAGVSAAPIAMASRFFWKGR
jgi:hypothetical protein